MKLQMFCRYSDVSSTYPALAPPLTAKLGYANLATAKMKLSSATTVGRCSLTARREAPGSRVYLRVQNEGAMSVEVPGFSFSRIAVLMSRCDCPVVEIIID